MHRGVMVLEQIPGEVNFDAVVLLIFLDHSSFKILVFAPEPD